MTSTRETINPGELHPAPGFSHITVAKGTRLIFIAGQVALGPDFSIIGGDDLGAQTEAAMRNLEVALRAVGATFDDVVRRTIYTTQPTEFETITAAIERVQQSTEHPAQTIVGVTGLALPGLLIEVEATVSLA
ncbi:MAG: RidA family protein [Solirubrobacterales bacterium]|nr:RidA family protein [Solirubrobacterales bacterium]MBV9425602.1 RidA family protein [Solirubrobacterales bacterium]MBV9797378.1 RidA family protein [Solirubrobacterales bacterium]